MFFFSLGNSTKVYIAPKSFMSEIKYSQFRCDLM